MTGIGIEQPTPRRVTSSAVQTASMIEFSLNWHPNLEKELSLNSTLASNKSSGRPELLTSNNVQAGLNSLACGRLGRRLRPRAAALRPQAAASCGRGGRKRESSGRPELCLKSRVQAGLNFCLKLGVEFGLMSFSKFGGQFRLNSVVEAVCTALFTSLHHIILNLFHFKTRKITKNP